MYTYMTKIHTHRSVSTDTILHIQVHTKRYTSIWRDTAYVHKLIHTPIHRNIHTYPQIQYIQTQTHACKHTDTYTHIQTHTHETLQPFIFGVGHNYLGEKRDKS